jgi:cell division protein ZipA
MEALRWLLLLLGVLVLAGVYLVGARARRLQATRNDPGATTRRVPPVTPGEAQALEHELGVLSEMLADERGQPHRRAPEPSQQPLPLDAASAPYRQPAPQQAKATPHREETLLVIQIRPRAPDARFRGPDILAAAGAARLSHGQRHIFHRDTPQGAALFSLVNLVEPGTFDPEAMADFSTPGLALFMNLPGPHAPDAALAEFLAAAHTLGTRLDGVLYDDQRRPLDENNLRARIAAYAQAS